MAACFRQDGTQHRPGSAPGAPVLALWHEKVAIRRYEGFAAILPVETGKACGSIASGLPDPVPVKSGNTRPLKPKKTCPMRQGNNPRRSRNKGGNGGGGNNNNGGNRRQVPLRSQNFDSNGPDVRIRGNAWQVYEKYMALARDAQTSGDPVRAENLMQHAEHYMRLINLANEENNERGGRPQGGDNNFYSGDQPAQNPSGYGFGGESGEAQEGGEFGARDQQRRDDNRDEGYREEGRENRRRDFSRDNNREGGRESARDGGREGGRDGARETRDRDNRDRDNRDRDGGERDWRRERNNRRQAESSQTSEPAQQSAEAGEPAPLFLDVSQPAEAAPRAEREPRQPRRRREPRQPRSEGGDGETLDAGLQRQLGLGGGSRRREREAVDNDGGSEEVDA